MITRNRNGSLHQGRKAALCLLLSVLLLMALLSACAGTKQPDSTTGMGTEGATQAEPPSVSSTPPKTEPEEKTGKEPVVLLPEEIAVEADSKVPAAVVAYARAAVAETVNDWNAAVPAPLTQLVKARITGLTQIETGTAGLNSAETLWLLEYRLMPEDADKLAAAQKLSAVEENGESWLTEKTVTLSALASTLSQEKAEETQPCLLLHVQDWENVSEWTPVCVTDTHTIETTYGTAEMLAQYGNAYTAAAMELSAGVREEILRRYLPASPQDAFLALWETGLAPQLTLVLVQDGEYVDYAPFSLEDSAETVTYQLESYLWEETELPDWETLTADARLWLTAASLDGEQSMLFYPADGGTIVYNGSFGSCCWQGRPTSSPGRLPLPASIPSLEGEEITIADLLRMHYDSLEANAANIHFAFEGEAAEALEHFAAEIFPEHLMGLEPLNEYGFTDYVLLSFEALMISEDGGAAVGAMEYVGTPRYYDSVRIWAGNTGVGTDEYEGMVTMYRQFTLQKQEDGEWHCLGLATGGARLPEG